MATPLSRQSSTSSGTAARAALDRPADLEPSAAALQGAVLHRVGGQLVQGERQDLHPVQAEGEGRAGRRDPAVLPRGIGPQLEADDLGEVDLVALGSG